MSVEKEGFQGSVKREGRFLVIKNVCLFHCISVKKVLFYCLKKLVVKGRILVGFLRKSNVTGRVLFRHK